MRRAERPKRKNDPIFPLSFFVFLHKPFSRTQGDTELRGIHGCERSGVQDRVHVHAVEATPVKAAALRLGASSAESSSQHRREAHPGARTPAPPPPPRDQKLVSLLFF